MAYLVAVIGGVENLTPATDRPERLSALVNLRSQRQAFQARLDPNRTDVLDAILPAPSRVPDLRRLHQFKDSTVMNCTPSEGTPRISYWSFRTRHCVRPRNSR